MANIGDGISSDAIEQDPGIAQIQAQQQAPLAASQVNLPATGFVGSINALSGLLTLQAGTSSPGVTVVVSSDGVSVISIGVTLTSPAVVKNNITAAPPTPGNDESEGYEPFSMWQDNTIPAAPTFYICASNTTMTAVWVALN